MATTRRTDAIARRLALLATLATSVTCKPAGDEPVHPPVYTPPPTRVPPVDAPVRDRALEDAKRVFVKRTCAMLRLGYYEESSCEVVADVGDWIVLRTSEAIAVGTRWRWFVAETSLRGQTLLIPNNDLPYDDGDPPMITYAFCQENTPDASPPTQSGLLGVASVEQGGRIELHLECKDSDMGDGPGGTRYLLICTSNEVTCDTSQMILN